MEKPVAQSRHLRRGRGKSLLKNMDNITHSEMVARLMKPKAELQFTPEQCDMIHAILGISGECGELLDAIKKHVIYGKKLDMENMREEMGDLHFYLAHLHAITGISEEDAKAANMAKLAKRYPGYNYTDNRAKKRADKADDGWIEWNGGECPVESGALVKWKSRNGICKKHRAEILRWNHDISDPSWDIIAYKLA